MAFTLTLDLLLRVGVFGTFFGHGFLAAMGNASWLPYLAAVGIHGRFAKLSMRAIGWIDIAVAVHTLYAPDTLVITWAALWAFATALVRPVSGEKVWAFVERAGNWTTPLALLWVRLQASGHAHPLVSNILAAQPFISATMPALGTGLPAFEQHMAVLAAVFVAGAAVCITLRLVNGK